MHTKNTACPPAFRPSMYLVEVGQFIKGGNFRPSNFSLVLQSTRQLSTGLDKSAVRLSFVTRLFEACHHPTLWHIELLSYAWSSHQQNPLLLLLRLPAAPAASLAAAAAAPCCCLAAAPAAAPAAALLMSPFLLLLYSFHPCCCHCPCCPRWCPSWYCCCHLPCIFVAFVGLYRSILNN